MTKGWTKNLQRQKHNFLQHKQQQQTVQLQAPKVLRKPVYVAGCREDEYSLLPLKALAQKSLLESRRSNTGWTGRVLYTSHWCLLCSSAPVKGSTRHSNAAAEAAHFSAMTAREKDSVWPHLSHQVKRWSSSRKDAAQRPCVPLHSPRLLSPWSTDFPLAGWLPRCPKSQ